MILPGVSGSFLLIILGKYQTVLGAVVERDIFSLAVFASGALVGIVVFARLVSYLFKEHHDLVVSILIGFMLGSLRKLWPWKETLTTRINSHGVEVPLSQVNILPQQLDTTVGVAILAALVAVVVVYYLDRIQLIEEQVEDVEDRRFSREHQRSLKEEKKGEL